MVAMVRPPASDAIVASQRDFINLASLDVRDAPRTTRHSQDVLSLYVAVNAVGVARRDVEHDPEPIASTPSGYHR